jgi:hypothetical protein
MSGDGGPCYDQVRTKTRSSIFYQRKFTRTSQVRRYLAVHDEILARRRGNDPHPFLVRGVLFIPHERRDFVFRRLQELRNGFTGRIHHREIKKTSGPRYETAERWLRWFKSEGIGYCSLKVFAVDQEGFKRFPYPGEHGYADHVLKNTTTSFVAGITWELPGVNAILLDVVCDRTGEQVFLDALARLPSEIRTKMLRKRRERRERNLSRAARGLRPLRIPPMVRVRQPVLCSSNPASDDRKAQPQEVEFLQLTDLLLGVLWDAVRSRRAETRSKAGRIRLVREMRETTGGSVLLPWALKLPIARAVSVSLYPDENGLAYPATVLVERPGQQPLPLPGDLFPERARTHELTSLPFADDDYSDPVSLPDGDAPGGIAVVDYLPLGRPLQPAEIRR